MKTNQSRLYGLVLIAIMIVLTDSTIEASNTTNPFYPCKSSTSSGQWSVVCDRVRIDTVKTVFNRIKTPYYIDRLTLNLNNRDYQITYNIIGNHSIGTIILNCPNRNKNPLVVNQNAFTLTKSFTMELDIYKCDLRKLNWSFLKGFSNLNTLSINYASNIHLTLNTLPSASLSSLTTVIWYSFIGIEGFKHYTRFPAPIPNGIYAFWIYYCDELNTNVTDTILKKWITPTSQNTLNSLRLVGLNLIKVPPEVSKYTQLSDMEIFENIHPMAFQFNAMNSTVPVQIAFFDNSYINSISPGAFTGDFKAATVVLVSNNLTTLDSGAFQTMLEQMETSNGYLEVAYNPIDCSPSGICSLAWLVRDNPNLLDRVWSATCSNGTYLHDLNPNAMQDRNGKKCPKSTTKVSTNAIGSANRTGVSDLFAPCQSVNTASGLNVVCNRISGVSVKNVCNKVKMPYSINTLLLTPNVKDSKIIANIIGNHTISNIALNCPTRKTNPLIVDPAAFAQTKLATITITVTNCDLQFTDWSFLKGFSNLMSFTIEYCSNFHNKFFTLPTPSLTSLNFVWLFSIFGMNGFNNTSLKFPPPVPNGISYFWVWGAYNMTTESLQNLLSNWVTPTSNKTLTSIQLGGDALNAIPADVSKYTQLTEAQFFSNIQPWAIQSGAFNFTVPELVVFDTSQITSVSAGTFKGDFKNALVSMYRNQLTTLNSGAFLPLLKQMETENGYLNVGANPLDCSRNNICNMAWLIRDHPSLLNSAWNARCSNGTYLFQLDPKNLQGPNGKRCP